MNGLKIDEVSDGRKGWKDVPATPQNFVNKKEGRK